MTEVDGDVDGDVDRGVGLTVVHRQYVSFAHAHYAGNLVDGAFSLARFGDVATEICIRTDGDEGLFASYSDVQFRAAIRAGDVLEVTGRVVSVGRRSRQLSFTATVICRGRPDLGPSTAELLAEPIVATTAVGTVVVPAKSTLAGLTKSTNSIPGPDLDRSVDVSPDPH